MTLIHALTGLPVVPLMTAVINAPVAPVLAPVAVAVAVVAEDTVTAETPVIEAPPICTAIVKLPPPDPTLYFTPETEKAYGATPRT
jgi:hypothetical protein